jgi:hypothetical protein
LERCEWRKYVAVYVKKSVNSEKLT